MSFTWDLSDGDDIAKVGSKYEIEGGSIEPIPNDTTCTAYIEQANIETNRDGLQFINIRWSVVAPSEYKNRKVFQKLWCLDDDPRAKDAAVKKDKAKKMLFVIDSNAGGKMFSSGKPMSDALLSTVAGKQMQIKVMTYEMEGNNGKMTGNWIAAISPKSGAPAPAKKAEPVQLDDEVPF